MTFLLTGATGFLGKRLVELLLEAGHSVIYLGRARSAKFDSRVAFHPWEDSLHTPAPLQSVPRHDVVIHLMGEPIAQRWTPAVKRRIEESRTLSTRNLVMAIAALAHKPKTFICSSAVGYYGDRRDAVLTEDSPAGEGFLPGVCSAWEREASRAREFGLRTIQMRTGVVLGPDGGALAQMLPAFRLGLAGRFGDGRQWMSWIHREDLLRMYIWAAQTESVEGALNGTAPEPVTNAEFTRTLAAALHRTPFLPVPRWALQLLLGEMSQFLFDSIRATPAAALGHGFRFEYPALATALASLVRRAA